MRTDFVEIEANGQRFRLYFDRDHPGVLHIYSRHDMTAEDAVAVFFYEGERGRRAGLERAAAAV